MKRILFLPALFLFLTATAVTPCKSAAPSGTAQDNKRIAELNQFWAKLSKTVKEGDYEGYGSLYHEDAVIVFATNNNKVSVQVGDALAGWKTGFDNTKAGKQKDNVVFRFSQRIGNDNTAHETGIFHFTSVDNSGNTQADILVHFEMLFVKKDGVWLATMEYQKATATKAEWEALKG